MNAEMIEDANEPASDMVIMHLNLSSLRHQTGCIQT